MTTKIEVQLSDADMKKLQAVAIHQGNDAEAVVGMALRLYLSRFNDLVIEDEEEGEK